MTQLRAAIPIAGPARRELADGSEPPLRAVLGFEPRWFHLRCGVDFSIRWHREPEYRRETLTRMLRELRRAFPSAAQWQGPDEPHIWTVGGCYGVGVVPALFGVRLEYAPDRWPVPLRDDAWQPPPGRLRLLDSPFAQEVLGQVDRMRAAGCPVAGDLNWQGVLNVAFHLRGERVFLEMVDSPGETAELFETIATAIVDFAHAVHRRQRASGFPIDFMCVSNCTVNMAGPRLYGRMLRVHDERIAGAFAAFGVHTCNWDVTPYLDELARLPKVGYLDMGFDSDLPAARRKFPEARLGVLYAPWLRDPSPAAVRADLRRIARQAAPCDVVVADIPWDTPDERVNDLLAACREVAAESLASAR
jgi:hypothetical protein